MKNITEVIIRTGKLLDQQQGEITIEHHEPGLDVVIEWDGAKCIIKPVIGTHRLEFRTPDNQWGWEIGIGYPEMPGAILAGLQIIKRIPRS
jgi:hypothetical protein